MNMLLPKQSAIELSLLRDIQLGFEHASTEAICYLKSPPCRSPRAVLNMLLPKQSAITFIVDVYAKDQF